VRGRAKGARRVVEEVRGMSEPMRRQLEDELARLRRLRDTTLAILQREEFYEERKLQAIERALQDERMFQGERDEDEEAEEARDRERLS
jgi:glycosyltransferase A (GT-A) superfamily protein (DUF2064 family)